MNFNDIYEKGKVEPLKEAETTMSPTEIRETFKKFLFSDASSGLPEQILHAMRSTILVIA